MEGIGEREFDEPDRDREVAARMPALGDQVTISVSVSVSVMFADKVSEEIE